MRNRQARIMVVTREQGLACKVLGLLSRSKMALTRPFSFGRGRAELNNLLLKETLQYDDAS